jgi:glycine/D-amino acid oxidase-like deaminating enzyme
VTREADVVIIGGGIVGCATAYYLGRRGVRPLLLERGEVASQQSGRNWGFVRQQGRDPREVPLMVEANRMWRTLEAELGADIDWVQGGNLALAVTEERMGLFEQWLEVARQHGIDTRLVRRRDLDQIVPGMQGDWVGGMYTPSDGHAEPTKATEAFAQAAAAGSITGLLHPPAPTARAGSSNRGPWRS